MQESFKYIKNFFVFLRGIFIGDISTGIWLIKNNFSAFFNWRNIIFIIIKYAIITFVYHNFITLYISGTTIKFMYLAFINFVNKNNILTM